MVVRKVWFHPDFRQKKTLTNNNIIESLAALRVVVPFGHQSFTFLCNPRDELIDNSRYSELTFPIVADSVLHGFGGYFECKLYKEIMISILPATHSPGRCSCCSCSCFFLLLLLFLVIAPAPVDLSLSGMFSWFPILFPLREPVQLKADDEVSS